MAFVPLNYNPYINAVIGADKKDSTTYYYYFAQKNEENGRKADAPGFVALNDIQQYYFKVALAEFSSVCNATFTQTFTYSNSNLRVSYDTALGLISGATSGISIWYNTLADPVPAPGTFAFHDYLHELGHVLKLRHPGSVTDGYGGYMPPDHYGRNYSVVYSGTDVVGGNTIPNNDFQSLGLDDIRALQYLYGANFKSNAGDTTYKWDSITGEKFINGVGQRAPIAPCIFSDIWDGGGIDTYDLSNFSTPLKIDLRPGYWSSFGTLLPRGDSSAIIPGNVANTYIYVDPTTGLEDTRSLIENAIGGSGDDSLTGNQVNNKLTGDAGNDTLDGGLGADTMDGGQGNDTYFVDNVRDVIIETVTGGGDAGGTDTVVSTITYSLTAAYQFNGSRLENLTLQGSGAIDGTGTDSANLLIGNAGDNHLYGLAGDDTLDGGGGSDTLYGGVGRNVYLFGFGSGTETIISDASSIDVLRFKAGIFALNVTWALDGGDLIGTLTGGDDRVIVKNWPSTASHFTVALNDGAPLSVTPGQGASNIVNGSTDTTLGVADKNLVLSGTAQRGTGNNLANIIQGNNSANILDGVSNTDAAVGDTLIGGLGDDTYYVRSLKDVLIENSNGGKDTVVVSSFDYTLQADFENLTLTGTSNLKGGGNDADNVIIGNDGKNALTGGGGNDTLDGGAGNDTLGGGSGDDLLIGGAGDDQLNGDSGDDTLDGGAGDDLLYAAPGNNTYIFGKGYGNDKIDLWNGGNDRVIFKEDVRLSDIQSIAYQDLASDKKGYLVITLTDGSTLTVWRGNGYNYPSFQTFTLMLHDGTIVQKPTNQSNTTVMSQGASDGDDVLSTTGEKQYLYGGNGNDSLTGGDGADTLDGGAGDDTLVGGSDGGDTMFGGAGDDSYYLFNMEETYEQPNEGNDTVYSAIKFSLIERPNIENLTLLQLPPDPDPKKTVTQPTYAQGNSEANKLTGNNANNILDGLKNKNASLGDTMQGGLGDDTYYVHNLADQVIEANGQGTDIAVSWIHDYTLPENVENLTLVEEAVNGTGNSASNLIIGDALDNTLYGKAGDDTLNGGAGDDTLDGGAGADKFIGGGGHDTASYADATAGVTVDLVTPANNKGDAAGDTYVSQLPIYIPSDAARNTFADFASGAGGWMSNTRYPRMLVDVNNDNKLDLVGFGEGHVFAALGDGEGGFGVMTPLVALDGFTPFGGGWNSNDRYPRMFADINGDGRVDAVGFGEEHTYVALGKADGSFGDMTPNAVLDGFTPRLHGWSSNDRYPRFLVDLDKDGKVDVVGFGEAHVFWAKNNGDGTFADMKTIAGLDNLTPTGGGWNSNDQFPRMFADVNGDGVLDVVGFGYAKVWVSLGSIDSKGSVTFGDVSGALDDFAVNGGGWVNNSTYPRFATDMNGDGMADLVGFGEGGVLVALATGGGKFAAPQLVFDNFGRGVSGGGWANNDLYPRLLGDLNHDGLADIVGFGESGIFVAPAYVDKISNVIGSDYNDQLSGDNGANVMTGGLGADRLSGLGGADTFVYTSVRDSTPSAADTITDFEHGIDRIDLSQIDISASQAGRQGFHFGATNGSSITAGDLIYNAATGVLSGYVDGDGVADFQITLANKPALSAGDFVL